MVLRLRFSDYATRATRSRTMAEATTVTPVILAALRGVLAAALPLSGSAGSRCWGSRSPTCATPTPSSSPCRSTVPARRARHGLDAVRERFGPEAMTRAVLIGRDPGVSMPLLPD